MDGGGRLTNLNLDLMHPFLHGDRRAGNKLAQLIPTRAGGLAVGWWWLVRREGAAGNKVKLPVRPRRVISMESKPAADSQREKRQGRYKKIIFLSLSGDALSANGWDRPRPLSCTPCVWEKKPGR
jgi:hypothetical protein